METNQESNIKKTVTKTNVIVDSLITGEFQKTGTLSAMLRQSVTTVAEYPSAVHHSDLQQNIFNAEEFTGDETQDFESTEKRVAFIDVPDTFTAEQVTARLNADASLYRILSNAPILTNNAVNAISRGVTTKDKIADSQAVRYPENHVDAGELIFDKQGRVQYRKVFFWATNKEDMDLRGNPEHPEYHSATIAEEVKVSTGVVLENQEVVVG